MTKNLKVGSSLDLMFAGVAAILGLLPSTAPIGPIASFGLFAWQNEKQQKLFQEFRRKFEILDSSKLDRTSLESDEFKALVVQAVGAASKSASHLKRKALAQALVNSLVQPTSQFSGKEALLRVLSQMSEEEMLALTQIHEKEQNQSENKELPGTPASEIASNLGWDIGDTIATCEGLLQLGLVRDARVGTYSGTNLHLVWRLTHLGFKLIRWCAE
jgi:hypothetical protein